MAYGWMVDPDGRQFGGWKMGYIVDGSNPIQAWPLNGPPYVYVPLTMEASDEFSNHPDRRSGTGAIPVHHQHHTNRATAEDDLVHRPSRAHNHLAS